MEKSLKIKKGKIVGLANWLVNQKLDGKKSRNRTRFVKVLVEEVKTLEEERAQIVEKYVAKEKNKEGNETYKKELVDNVEFFVFEDGNKEKFEKEINDLFSEEFIVVINESNTENISIIKNIVLNTKYLFGCDSDDSEEEKNKKIQEQNDYESWCEIFEAI